MFYGVLLKATREVRCMSHKPAAGKNLEAFDSFNLLANYLLRKRSCSEGSLGFYAEFQQNMYKQLLQCQVNSQQESSIPFGEEELFSFLLLSQTMKARRSLPSSGNKGLECSSSVHKTRTKKKKRKHENVDMISHLPDPLLHHIFSFLDIKQAIQTCILSRRWRYFWVSLPFLNFNYNRGTGYFQTRNKNDFMDFVDRVLILRDSSNIQKLTVVIKEQCNITDRLHTWILTSVIRNIQKLHLQIYTARNLWELPHCLSNCKSLTKLVLALSGSNGQCPMIILPSLSSFTLPRLKTLSIGPVQFEGKNSFDGFVSERCLPVLETLILKNLHFPIGSLNLSSRKLKHLKLQCYDRGCYHTSHSVDIHLCCPNLKSLCYYGYMFKHCILENLSSLVKADICVIKKAMVPAEEICYGQQQSVNILRELHNVEELKLSLKFLEIATGAPELLDNHSTQFRKLKCLKLEGSKISLDRIRGVSYILNASPNIESLCVRLLRRSSVCNCQYCNETQLNSANKGDCWGDELSLEHLKFFEFRNARACVNELKFIEILLNKAVVLEKLFIVFGFGKSPSDDKKCQVKFKEKVLTFARVSSRTAILFK